MHVSWECRIRRSIETFPRAKGDENAAAGFQLEHTPDSEGHA